MPTLYQPGTPIPAAIAPNNHQGIHAADFSGNVIADRYFFGLDKDRAVAQLRMLANEIESGKKVFQEATVYSKATLEDFTLTTLRLKWADGIK